MFRNGARIPTVRKHGLRLPAPRQTHSTYPRAVPSGVELNARRWRPQGHAPAQAGADRASADVAKVIPRDPCRYFAAWATWSAMSWSMRAKASSSGSSPAITWLVRVTSAA